MGLFNNMKYYKDLSSNTVIQDFFICELIKLSMLSV